MPVWRLAVRTVALLLAAGAVGAADPPSPTAVAFHCGGGASSNGTLVVIGALGATVSGAPAEAPGGVLYEYPGFPNAYLVAPWLDTDADGVPDENDPDNDNDGLCDGTELAGTAFVPATPSDPVARDSDRDGAADGAEAAAGTNPADARSVLSISGLRAGRATALLRWKGRGGMTYEIVGTDTAERFGAAPTVLGTITAAGGAPPWFATESELAVEPGPSNRMFRVRVARP